MPGLPGIHVLKMRIDFKDVDGRDNPRRCGGSPGHDDTPWSRLRAARPGCRCAHPGYVLLAALLLWTMSVPAAGAPKDDAPASPAMAEYQRKLAEYTRAREAFDEEAGAYWTSIAEKRRARNGKRRNKQEIVIDDYVLTQPPVY